MMARYYGNSLSRFISFDSSRMGVNRALPQTWNGYTYVSNNPLLFIDPNGLYQANFHSGWTYFLAKRAGYTEDEARTIATANNAVDSGSTSPFTILGGADVRRLYHGFEADRAGLEQSALAAGSLEELGARLHPFQDSFSHEGFGATFGHLAAGHKPDILSNDPAKAVGAAMGTYGILSQKAAEMGKHGLGAPDQQLLGALAGADANVENYDTAAGRLTVSVGTEEEAKKLAANLKAQGYKVKINGKAQ